MENTVFMTNGTARISGIVPPLLAWYEKNARVLPWRENTDPYRVWVSEIMLQQTRVETVIPYYNRFMRRFPDVASLAEAEEEQIMKLWEGLGYYSRARNLQKAARKIMAEYGGRFPRNVEDIRTLPGIGTYTAGAIASICFGEPVPAVDGNVLRVAARLTGYEGDISRPEAKAGVAGMLADIYPKARSGDFTQSLMELGAMVCLPNGAPKCVVCPVAFLCRAYETEMQEALPVRHKKKPRQKETKTVFLLSCGKLVAVRRRAGDVLLGGLWEFPNTAGDLTPKEAEEFLMQWGISAGSVTEGIRKKHIFTHVEWEMRSYLVSCRNLPADFVWVTKEKLAGELTLPSAFRAFLGSL